MRILLDARMLGHTGIGRYVKSLIREYARLKIRHELVIVMHRGILSSNGDGEDLSGLPLLDVVYASSRLFSLGEQWELVHLVKRVRPDLVHSPQFNVPFFVPSLQVTTIHDCAYDRFPDEFRSFKTRAYYRFVFRQALHKSDAIIAVSWHTAEELRALHSVRGNIYVIHHGVDEKFFCGLGAAERARARLRARYGLEKPFCLYVGLVRPRKNLVTLLRAFSLLLGKYRDDILLVVVGPQDKHFLDLDLEIRRLHLEGSVRGLERVPEDVLLDLYAAAQVFVMPSLYEGFGLPVLEAMASGTPVVAGNASALPEVAGDAALLVDPLDAAGIATAVDSLLSDGGLRRRLTSLGVIRAKQFTWQRCAEETLRVYDSVWNHFK